MLENLQKQGIGIILLQEVTRLSSMTSVAAQLHKHRYHGAREGDPDTKQYTVFESSMPP